MYYFWYENLEVHFKFFSIGIPSFDCGFELPNKKDDDPEWVILDPLFACDFIPLNIGFFSSICWKNRMSLKIDSLDLLLILWIWDRGDIVDVSFPIYPAKSFSRLLKKLLFRDCELKAINDYFLCFFGGFLALTQVPVVICGFPIKSSSEINMFSDGLLVSDTERSALLWSLVKTFL